MSTDLTPVKPALAVRKPELTEASIAPNPKTFIVLLMLSIGLLLIGILLRNSAVTIVGSSLAVLISGRIFYPSVKAALGELLSPQDGGILIASIGLGVGIIGFLQVLITEYW